MYLIERITTYL